MIIDGVVPEIASATPAPAPAISPLGFHPLAQIFPLLSDDGLQALANDIAQHGLLDEIVLYEGEILDGRCRYLACDRVGVAPKFNDYVGDDPLGFVISRNVHRRHLTTIQRTFAAARAATLPVGANQCTPGLPIGGAAEIFHVSERNIARAKAILRRGTADLVQAVESGKVAISRAAELCELAHEEQIATVKDIAERKRNPQKKKASAGAVNENVAVVPADGASQPECLPSTDGLDIPDFLKRHDATDQAFADDLMAEWQKAEPFRRAWGNASVAARKKFYADVMQACRE
jgi:ParB-like chromosome segregation protein Spo0J